MKLYRDLDYDRIWGNISADLLVPWLRNCKFRRVRPIRQWMEDEIVLVTGPYAGRHFRFRRQPAFELLYRELESEYWREYALTGPSQCGKSLTCFVSPILYYLFERVEDVIAVAPTMELCQDKWARDILPVLQATRYADQIPKRGTAARGGFSDRVQFANGAVLKWMSGGGGDTSKASYTARVIIFTEADGYTAISTSVESHPINQVLARARATERANRVIIYEGTTTTEDGFIWPKIHKYGSAGKIHLRCPHCKKWVTPEREHLKGWQDAASELQIEKKAAWHCPNCDRPWTESERREANNNAVLCHGNQVVKWGKARGEVPETRTCGFRLGAVNNMFLPAQDLAYDEWEALRAEDEVDAERRQTMFVFAIPFKPPGLDRVKLDEKELEQRRLPFTREAPPQSTKWVTVGVDIGKHDCWYVVIAWMMPERVGLVIDYGRIRIRIKTDTGHDVGPDELGFAHVFPEVMTQWKQQMDRGWVKPDGEVVKYDQLWMDARYQGEENDDDVIYQTLRRWKDKRCLPIMGHSQNNYRPTRYREPQINSKLVVTVGHYYDVRFIPEIRMMRGHIDVDSWIEIMQRRFAKEANSPGSLMLYESNNPGEHTQIIQHIKAVTRERHFEPGKGNREKLIVKREANHLGDAMVYATAAGHYMGFRVDPVNDPKPRPIARPRGPVVRGRGGRSFLASQR